MTAAVTNDISEQDFLDMQGNLRDLLVNGGNLASVRGITEQECEGLYQIGHGFYSQGRYQEAFRIFALLVSYDHLEGRFLMALAASCQVLGRHKEALQYYGTAAVLLLTDPAPMLHAAECCIALHMAEEAAEALQMALELAGDAPQHAAVRNRAQALLAPLEATVAQG